MTVSQFTWTNKSPPGGFTKRFRHISHSPILGYCAVGDATANIVTSTDGDTWTEQVHGYAGNYFLYVNHNNSIWVAVGGDENVGTQPAIYTSPDGVNWTSRTSPINFRYLYGVIWTGSSFVACGSEGSLLTSSDGTTWVQRSVPEANGTTLYRLAYNGAGRVVLGDGAGRMWYSDDDGATWARAMSPLNDVFPSSLQNLVWTGSYFLATSNAVLHEHYASDVHNTLATSLDGYTWQIEDYGQFMDIRAPKTYCIASDGSGTCVLSGFRGWSIKISGSPGSLTFEHLPNAEVGDRWDWFRGMCYDGTNYYMAGDDARIRKGTFAQVSIATNPSPLAVTYATSGTNTTSITPILSWTGIGTGTHAVYFGENPDSLSFMSNVGTAQSWNPGTLECNHSYWWRIDIVDGGNTYVGNLWHFVTVPTTAQPEDRLSVLGATYTLDSGQNITTGWTTKMSFNATQLVHGHRYLINESGRFYTSESARADMHFFVKSAWYDDDVYYDGTFAFDYSTHSQRTMGSAYRFVAGEDFNYMVETGGSQWTMYQHYLTAMDLDSPGMEYGKDWFFCHDSNQPRFTTSWAPMGAELTFTPDGYSDYLVFGIPNVYGYTTGGVYDNMLRLRNTTSGKVLMQYGHGTYIVTRDYQRSYSGMRVLEKPPAVRTTIAFEGYSTNASSNWYLYSSNIIVLRLNKFEKYVYDQSSAKFNAGAALWTANIFPPTSGNNFVDPKFYLNFKPDSTGKGVVLFSMCADTYSRDYGVAYLVRYGDEDTGTRVLDSEAYYSRGGTIDSGDTINTNDTANGDQAMPVFASRYLTNLTSEKPISVFIGSTTLTPINYATAVAFGIKYASGPQVRDFDPSDQESCVAPSSSVSFLLSGTNVKSETLNVQASLSAGWQENYTGLTNVRKMAYDGSGMWVAVGSVGQIATSTDGYSWVTQTSGTDQTLLCITYGNGMWVAGGYSGTILSSPDGINWTTQSSGTTSIFYDVVYGGGQFVMVGASGVIRTSPDGITWAARGSETQYMYGVAYNGTDMYCAVGWAGFIITSADGITWTPRTSNTTEALYGVAHDQQGRWVATVLYTHYLLTSTNGINWSWIDTRVLDPETADLRDVNYGGGRWVVTGHYGTIITSIDDTASWVKTKHRYSSVLAYPYYSEGKGWRVAADNGTIYTSPNGGASENFVSLVCNGIINQTYCTQNSSILPTDDGYLVELEPQFGLFSKNQLVTIKINAEDQISSMPEFMASFTTTDKQLKTITAERLAAVSPTGVWTNVINIPAKKFVPGHRYVMFVTASWYPSDGSGLGYFDIYIGDQVQYDYRCYYRGYSNYGQYPAMIVREMQENEGVTCQCYSHPYFPVTDFRFVAIDLDSDMGTFKENDNWFHNYNTSRISNMNATFTSNIGASITFTPDGISDYLVMGSAFLDDCSGGYIGIARLNDSVSGELSRAGYYSPYGGECALTAMHVLSAPPASSRTISIQMTGAGVWDHDASHLVIIKMDSFVNKGFAQTITQQTGFSTTDTVVETINFVPDAYGEALIFSQYEFNDYFRQEIDVAGSNILAHPGSDAQAAWFHNYNSTTGVYPAAIGVVRKPALAWANPTSIQAVTSAQNTSAILYKRRIIALGTELFAPPPTKVTAPDPFNGETEVNLEKVLSWAAGDNTLSFNVYFGLTNPPPFVGNQITTSYDPPGPYIPNLNTTYYWRVDSIGDGGNVEGDLWQFTTVETFPPPTGAEVPYPENDAIDVSVDPTITWIPGTSLLSISHDVYFGDAYEAVRDATVISAEFRGNTGTTSFRPAAIPMNSITNKLEGDSDYYWRIDERNVGGVTKGEIWHFKTIYVDPPTKATLPDPGHTQTDVIPDSTLYWTAGDRTIASNVYFGTDPDPSGNFVETRYVSNYNPPGNLNLNQNYYWRIDEVGSGGIATGDVWMFKTLVSLPYPTKASDPYPPDGAVNIKADDNLRWSAGTGIPYIGDITHDVYFGTDADPSSNYKTNTISPAYGPGLMHYSTTYYWRVDEVRERDPSSLPGDVWSFSTAPIYTIRPRDGDKVFSVIDVEGQTTPYVGIHAEVHTDRLIADGYTTSNASGEFILAIPYENQLPGTRIRLVMVTQASPDSDEVVVNLVQGRNRPQPIVLRTGRRVNADDHTVALWRFRKSVLQQYQGTLKLNLNFSGIPTVPVLWSSNAPHEGFSPTFSNGIMTTHCYSTPEAYSNVARTGGTGIEDITFNANNGFIIRFSWRTARGSIYSPQEGSQTMLYVQDSRNRVAMYYTSYATDKWSIYNAAYDDFTWTDTTIPIDKYNWTDVEIRGMNLIYNDKTKCYMETYLNGELSNVCFPDALPAGSSNLIYIGNANAGAQYTTSDLGYYLNFETPPFIERPGTNTRGNVDLDLRINYGCGIVKAPPSIPSSDHSLYLSGGSSSYLESDYSAFNMTGAFTVEGWINLGAGAVGSERVIFGKQSRNASGWCFRVNSAGQLELVMYSGSAQTISTGFSPAEKTWYHVAVVWTGTVVYVFINGNIIVTSAPSYVPNSSQPFRIGSYSDAAASLFKGWVYDVRVSDIARSSWEIYNVYNALSDPQEGLSDDSNTLFVWNFDDDPGVNHIIGGAAETFKEIDFTEEEVPKYFKHYAFGDGGDGYASYAEHDGHPVLYHRTQYVAGVSNYSNSLSRGRVRITGDFDVTIDVDVSKWTSCLGDHASARMILIAASYSQAQVLYETWKSGTTYYVRYRFYLSGEAQHTVLLSSVVDNNLRPNTIKMRIAREGCRWHGYYGINGAPAETYLGNCTGVNDDCTIQLYSNIDDTYPNSGNYDLMWSNLSVQGFNNYDSDGYMFYDVHGGDGYNTTSFRASAVGDLARDFDGYDDYVQMDNHSDWNHRDLSIEAWFQPDTLQNSCIVSRYNTDPSIAKAHFYIKLNSDGTITGRIGDSDGNYVSITSTAGTYIANAWYYLAMTFDSSERKLHLYLNGRMIGTSVMPVSVDDYSSGLPVDVGRNGGTLGEYFNGAIGSLRFSNISRTPKQIFDTYYGSNIKIGK